MKVIYRWREGKVEEIVDRAKVVFVKRWEKKVLCVPFEKVKKRYYLACLDTKLSSFRVKKKYVRRWEIEVFIRVAKQEFGLEKFRVRRPEGMKNWIYLCFIAYLLCVLKGGRWRERKRGEGGDI